MQKRDFRVELRQNSINGLTLTQALVVLNAGRDDRIGTIAFFMLQAQKQRQTANLFVLLYDLGSQVSKPLRWHLSGGDI